MSKELKAPDKVTQKMTRDGAVAENLTTGETSSISERPQEENYSAPQGWQRKRLCSISAQRLSDTQQKARRKKPLTRRSLKPILPACSFRSGTGNAGTSKSDQEIG